MVFKAKTLKQYLPIWRYIYCVAITILFLNGITLFFASCSTDDIDTNEKPTTTITGRDGNLNFVLNFDAYGESEDISTRNAADWEAETIVVPLGDGISMFATLEPVSRGGVGTRSAALRIFAPDTRINIVAYKQSANPTIYDYEKHVGFRVETSGLASKLEREGWDPFTLTIDDTYKFVAYSYNDNVTPLPAAGFPSVMHIEDIYPGLDLIWGASGDTHIGSGSNDVFISMKHKFSKVQIDAMSSVGNISAISNVNIRGYTACLDVETGDVTAFADSAILFTGFLPNNTASVSSTPRIVYTAEANPIVATIGSVTIGNKTYNNLTTTFARTLLSGFEYNLKIGFKSTENMIDDTPPAGMNMYVGAFWKANQTGERLIRIARPGGSTDADGAWRAVVVDGADWIALDKGWTTDGGVYGTTPDTYETNAAFDADHALPSIASTAVTGDLRPSSASGYEANDEYIRFRIGLKSTYTPTPTAPVRYGVVLLTYANNAKQQRIFIRQGEEPDFLMKPGDLDGSGNSVADNRNKARKFSPYNLTADNMNAAVDISGASPASNPGLFTAYPSQAGALFQWAGNGSAARYAYDSYNTAATGWNTVMDPGFWSVLSDTHETCPPGYRRPNDGPVNNFYLPGNVSESEIRQSLFLDPVSSSGISSTTNSMYGYYADGFFDRGNISTGIGTSPGTHSTVASGSPNIAHIGRLFFNPDNNAALFFPGSGYRHHDNPGMQYMGAEGSYRTGSVQDNDYSWSMNINASNASFNYTFKKNAAFNIRCVVTTLAVSPRSVWLSPSTLNMAKTIQITSSDPWVVESFPDNASLSVLSGLAGVTNLTITRSETAFGLQTLVIKNTVNGELIYVSIDNYNIDEDDEFDIPNNLLIGNAGEFEVFVDGGSEAFTIVSHSPWFTASITPAGKLLLTAPQTPDLEHRSGTITLAHADDPDYRVTFVVDQDLHTNIPPFKFFVMKFTWEKSDIDIAVEFAGNSLMTNGQPVPFDNDRFYDGVNYNLYRAVGYFLSGGIGPNGGRLNYTGVYTERELADSLMFWGGDATAGQGETVFFNAPMITPTSRKADTSGLPRKINLEVYVHWWSNGMIDNPVRLRIMTYDTGVMKHCLTDNAANNIRMFNFYNVENYSLPLTPENIIPPVFEETRVNVVDTQGGSLYISTFRSASSFTHICSIEYDRYTHGAKVTWHAQEYTGSIILKAPMNLQKSESKPFMWN